MGVDKPGNDDPLVGVDDRDVARHGDIGTHLADLAVLDQQIRLCEVADLPIEREHHAALEQDPARTLDTGMHRIGLAAALRRGRRGQHLRGSATADHDSARLQKRAARRQVICGRRSIAAL